MSKEINFPAFSIMSGSKIVVQRNGTNQEILYFNQSGEESNSVLMKAFPRLVPVGCFSALSTGWLFFAWYPLEAFSLRSDWFIAFYRFVVFYRSVLLCVLLGFGFITVEKN